MRVNVGGHIQSRFSIRPSVCPSVCHCMFGVLTAGYLMAFAYYVWTADMAFTLTPISACDLSWLLRSPTQYSRICPVICVSVAGRRPCLIATGLRKCDIGRSSGQPAQPSPVRHQRGSMVDRRSPSFGAYYRCSRQFPLALRASSSNWLSSSTELFTALHLGTYRTSFSTSLICRRDAEAGCARRPPVSS